MFDLDEPTTYRRRPKSKVPQFLALWFTMFSSVFCALILAGLLLGLGVRWYILSSVRDTTAQMEQRLREIQTKRTP